MKKWLFLLSVVLLPLLLTSSKKNRRVFIQWYSASWQGEGSDGISGLQGSGCFRISGH